MNWDDSAYLIDMDGLLLDTERLSYLSWQKATDKVGVSISQDVFTSIIGQSMANIQIHFDSYFETKEKSLEFIEHASFYYKELLDTDELKPMIGAEAFLSYLEQHQLDRCLVTSTERTLADRKLDRVGFSRFLTHRICGDDVQLSKPNPEIYMKAIAHLKREPKECIAVEDSINGVCSALAAGCHVVHVPDLVTLPEDLREKVDLVVPSLVELLKEIRL